MDTEQQPPKSAVMRVHTLAVIAASVLLIVIAFLAGLVVAMRGAQLVDTEVGDDVTEEEIVDDVDEVDDVAADWDSEERGTDHPFNFYLRQWWESEMVSDEARANTYYPFAYSATIIDTMEGGLYDGYSLVDNRIEELYGIGSSSRHFYLLEQPRSDAQAIVLTRYGYNEAWGFDQTLTYEIAAEGLVMSDMTLAGFVEPVTTLMNSEGTMTFTFLGMDGQYNEAIEYGNVVETAGGPTLYEAMSSYQNIFYFLQPDGRAAWYDANIAFWDIEDGATSGTPAIVWNDGAEVTEYIKGEVGGCGFVNPVHVVDEADVPELAVTGYATSDASIAIYEPADYADVEDGDEYRNWKSYTERMSEGTDTSIAAFAAEHATFYYQDALGRWTLFMTTHAVLAAECGKPVIYLYPTTTTNIDVSLAPEGGFTKTEPAYGNGWHVTAQPDGTLTNLADGLTYPYLFWEGRGGLYSAPQKYWVIAKGDVPTFLTSTLAKLGLNAKESADFMEFWLPRMTAAPYYKIGFHGTNVMNAIAPMTLSQKADTLVRILMDYSELSTPIAANPPTLGKAPTRTGFTVIEWGGVIR